MKYTVVWLPRAESEMARLWLDANPRGMIAAACDAIDSALSNDPFGVGESRDGDRRILLIWPLAVTYVVRESDRLVQVREVWRYDR